MKEYRLDKPLSDKGKKELKFQMLKRKEDKYAEYNYWWQNTGSKLPQNKDSTLCPRYAFGICKNRFENFNTEVMARNINQLLRKGYGIDEVCDLLKSSKDASHFYDCYYYWMNQTNRNEGRKKQTSILLPENIIK